MTTYIDSQDEWNRCMLINCKEKVKYTAYVTLDV